MTHTTSMGAETGFGLFPAMRHEAPPRILSARPANLPLAVLRIDETNPSGKIEGGEVSLVQGKKKMTPRKLTGQKMMNLCHLLDFNELYLRQRCWQGHPWDNLYALRAPRKEHCTPAPFYRSEWSIITCFETEENIGRTRSHMKEKVPRQRC